MKKLMFLGAILCAVAFSSCNKDEKKCWKITYKLNFVDFHTAMWASENEIDAKYGKYENFQKEVIENTSEPECLFEALGVKYDK